MKYSSLTGYYLRSLATEDKTLLRVNRLCNPFCAVSCHAFLSPHRIQVETENCTRESTSLIATGVLYRLDIYFSVPSIHAQLMFISTDYALVYVYKPIVMYRPKIDGNTKILQTKRVPLKCYPNVSKTFIIGMIYKWCLNVLRKM